MSHSLQKRPQKLLDRSDEVIRKRNYAICKESPGNRCAQYDVSGSTFTEPS